MTAGSYDPTRALRFLQEHGVRYVLIGGFAGNVRGAPINTNDLDICYERTAENRERLAAALNALNARLRVAQVDEELPFILDARTLNAGDSLTFRTDAGDVDVLATPSGTSGFGDLDHSASTYDLGEGLLVRVCSLDDLIRMKEAAGRRKDHVHLEELTALRDMIREQEESGRQ